MRQLHQPLVLEPVAGQVKRGETCVCAYKLSQALGSFDANGVLGEGECVQSPVVLEARAQELQPRRAHVTI